MTGCFVGTQIVGRREQAERARELTLLLRALHELPNVPHQRGRFPDVHAGLLVGVALRGTIVLALGGFGIKGGWIWHGDSVRKRRPSMEQPRLSASTRERGKVRGSRFLVLGAWFLVGNDIPPHESNQGPRTRNQEPSSLTTTTVFSTSP